MKQKIVRIDLTKFISVVQEVWDMREKIIEAIKNEDIDYREYFPRNISDGLLEALDSVIGNIGYNLVHKTKFSLFTIIPGTKRKRAFSVNSFFKAVYYEA